MDKRELLAEFNKQLDELDKFQTFIEKASASTKFSATVVAKVVADNTAKIKGVVDILEPLVGQLKDGVASLKSDRSVVEETAGVARLGLEELELRKEIGEIDDAEFGKESSGFKSELENAATMMTEIDSDLSAHQATLDRWLAARPGQAPAPAPAAAPAAAPASVVAAPPVQETELEYDDEPVADDDDAFADVGRGSGVHAERVSVRDDVSVVFETAEESGSIEAVEEESGLAFGEDELGDLGEDLQSDAGPSPVTGEAVVVQNEGTRDEIIYRFSGDVISLGRGRDNTVQVKNDSKVSRYHCKVFRRDGAYYIEDNKSANGTLVDGELITEKRLLGGEELVVGETFFKFRLRG
jgi:hypothetical protein